MNHILCTANAAPSSHTAPPTPTPAPLAVWQVRFPLLSAVLLGVGGLILTAVGSAAGMIGHLPEIPATGVQAACVAVSAVIGWLIMRRTRPTLAAYGFRSPRNASAGWWFLPCLVVVAIVPISAGFSVGLTQALAYLALTVAVGFNEEIWYRGLSQAVLRVRGTRYAVVWGSVLFGVVHLANLAGGVSPLYAALQVVFAAIFGFVLAELVAITGSLWPGIAWHAAYDFMEFSSGDVLNSSTLAGLAAMTAVLVGYGVLLWRRVPA